MLFLRSWLLFFLFLGSMPIHAEELILWNRNYDTAPIDKIVELALSKTLDVGPAYTLARSEPMEQNQAIESLAQGIGLDLMSAASSKQHQQSFHVVRFPLLKGLLGHRLCLIRKGEQSLFHDIQTVFDFRQKGIKVCQGEFWPDTRVLGRNGFLLATSPTYLRLFDMLRDGECDCFLRGAQEISAELARFSEEFELEAGLAVYYPQPGVLYVNRKRPELAARLELGLLRALDDGDFDQLFDNMLGSSMTHFRLENRQYLSLENPFLDSQIGQVLTNQDMWYQP